VNKNTERLQRQRAVHIALVFTAQNASTTQELRGVLTASPG